jgi:hypothetical protein
MTIALQPIKFRYQGNGATAIFSFANKIYDETDLIVEILDRTTSALIETLTYVTHYSVSIAANGYATVTITNPAKIPSNTQDVLLRALFPFTQTAEFNSGTVLPAETIENMGDKLTSIVQQLDESVGRSLKYNAQSPVTNPTIANPVADATLAFDGTTGALKAGATLGDISNAAANATSAAASAATASAASVAAQAANGGIGRVVRLATSGNVTLSGLQTIDGVVGAEGDRILVRANTTSSQNGLYNMSSGAWTRVTDANTWSSFVGMIITVAEGTARKNHVYISLATQGGTLGATAITFDTVPINLHVTTAKIADGAVTSVKIADANVTTAKILDGNVTNAKLATQPNVYNGGTAGGTANAITLTVPGLAASWGAGTTIVFKPSATNTGAATVNINGVGAGNIVRPSFASSTTGCVSGEIINGVMCVLVYDGINYVIQNPNITNPAGAYLAINGLIIQWGSGSVPANTTSTFNFPITFPNGILTCVVGLGITTNTSTNGNDSTGGGSISTSQYQVRNGIGSGGNRPFQMIAIGY